MESISCEYASADVRMMGNDLYGASSRIQDGDELHSVYDFWHHDKHILLVISQAQNDLYHITKHSQYLINVSMHQRWKLTITSTSASPFPIHQSIIDPTRKPILDLRCMDASDIGSDGDAVLVAMGVGRSVFLVLATHLSHGQVHWQQHSFHWKSDVMDVSIGAWTRQHAILLVGTRAGSIVSYSISVEGTLVVHPQLYHYAYKSSGSVCHLSFVRGSEFVCAYSNGDLLLGDASRMHCQPTRMFRGHSNHFRQGLVRTNELTQGFSVEPCKRLLACAGDNYRVCIWSLDDPDPLTCLLVPSSTQTHEFPSLITSLAWCSPAPDLSRPDASTSGLCLALGCGSDLFLYSTDMLPPP